MLKLSEGDQQQYLSYRTLGSNDFEYLDTLYPAVFKGGIGCQQYIVGFCLKQFQHPVQPSFPGNAHFPVDQQPAESIRQLSILRNDEYCKGGITHRCPPLEAGSLAAASQLNPLLDHLVDVETA